MSEQESREFKLVREPKGINEFLPKIGLSPEDFFSAEERRNFFEQINQAVVAAKLGSEQKNDSLKIVASTIDKIRHRKKTEKPEEPLSDFTYGEFLKTRIVYFRIVTR